MLRVRAACAPPRTRGGGLPLHPQAPLLLGSPAPCTPFGKPEDGDRSPRRPGSLRLAARCHRSAPSLHNCPRGPDERRLGPPPSESEPAASGGPGRRSPSPPSPGRSRRGWGGDPPGRPQSWPLPGTPAGRAPGPPFPPRSPPAPRPLSGLATCRGARAQKEPPSVPRARPLLSGREGARPPAEAAAAGRAGGEDAATHRARGPAPAGVLAAAAPSPRGPARPAPAQE